MNNSSGSCILHTVFSPKAVGTVETRTSTSYVRVSSFLCRPEDAAFRDVHLGHGLDAGGESLVQSGRNPVHIMQYSIDTHPDQGLGSLRLDVNVAGPE